MDCTQVLESDELNDSVAYKYKVKVAELKVNDNLYPIFSGSNRIGRDPEFCSVVFNNMTLSKEHAVIEVEDRFSHLIYDLGSKNKTRVGKTILKPHIRYQLLDKSQILLGDLSAEYFIIPEEQENKPFAVIQESDDEVIPDTPVQVKSRGSKDSSSSREESPTIFQMETECELGYVEPRVKIAQEPIVLEGNLTESSHPGENKNNESSTAGASNTSDTIATGGSAVNACETNIKESTTEVNHTSDGDETDPEDIFFAMTQKRDESLMESSDRETTSEPKETVEKGQPEDTDQVVDDSIVVSKTIEVSEDDTKQQNTEKDTCSTTEVSEDDTRQQNTEKVTCSTTEGDEDVSSEVNQMIVPEVQKIQEESGENESFSGKEGSKENEAQPKETHISNSIETNSEGSSKTVVKELNEENGGDHIFKQPLAAHKEQNKTEKTAQEILPVGEMPGERIETVDENSDVGSEDDSFFNAATQVLQPENQALEVFKTPLGDTAQEQEADRSPETNESCNVTGRNEEIGDKECNSENIPDAPVQVIQSEDTGNSSGTKLDAKEQVPCALAGKLSTCEKDDVGDSDATTDDESSFFNAPTQIVHAENEHTIPSPDAESEKPINKASPDRMEICGNDEQEKEGTMEGDDKVKEADDFIFSAPMQVQVKKKENSISLEKDVEPRSEQHRSSGSVIEEGSGDDSIFEAPTQIIIHSENSHEDLSKSLESKKEPERKETDQKQRSIVSMSETNVDDSIYDAETQVFHAGSETPMTFATSTPAKKKSVKFIDLSDEHQSSERGASSGDSSKQESTASKSENEPILKGPNKVAEAEGEGSSSLKEPGEDPKLLNDVPTEEDKNHVSQHGKNSNQQSSSETKLLDTPQIHPLDDSDDSIFSAPTQIISKPSLTHDTTSSSASASGKFNSSSPGTEAVLITENNEKKNSSDQNSHDESIDPSRKEEETLNDSFFEAATQLYTSTTSAEVVDSPGEDKANKSLSRSSSYSSIHEAPTQCMDDLVAGLESEKAKDAEKSGQVEEIQEKKREVVEGTSAEEPLQESESATAASHLNESIDLILPSSQELRKVGQECFGYASDDEKPSTSSNVSSPIIQKRTRSIPVKKGIRMARGLELIKSTEASGSRDTDSKSVKSLHGSDSKGQPDSESTKEGKLSKDKNDPKKTASKKKAMAVKGSDKSKKITDYLESNNCRDKSAEKDDKNENKASDETETGRPSRQRKPTWKARESSQEGLLTGTQKARKGDTKDQSKVSPGSSKQTRKKHDLSPCDDVNIKEDEIRKETTKQSTKINTESCVNSESELENNVKQKESKNLDLSVSSGKQRNIHVDSSSPQSEEEKIPTRKGMQLKQSVKELNKLKTKELNTSSPESGSSSERRIQTSVDPSSSKKRGKGSNVPSSSVEPKAEKGTTRSRKKSSDIPDMSSEAKQEVSPSSGSLQNEEVDHNKRGRRKRTTAVVDVVASVGKSATKAAIGKTRQESSPYVDRQENKDISSSSIEDKSVSVAKRGRPRHTPAASSASSSDVEVKSGKRISPSREKQTESRVKRTPEKAKESVKKEKENRISPCDKLDVKKRGRPKRSRASSVEMEPKPVVGNKRTQDSDICDTPTKGRKISVSVSSSKQDKSVDAAKRGRAKRSASKAFGLDKELNAAVSTAQVQRLEESDICDTPRKQRRNHVPSSESSDVEIAGTKRRGRSKRSATPSVSSERETASSLESNEVEIVETNKRGRSRRTGKSSAAMEKETAASSLQSDTVEIIETNKRNRSKKSAAPRVLKQEGGASLESGEIEIIGTPERSRSKRSAVPNVPVASKEERTPTKGKSDVNAKSAPTSPQLTGQRRIALQTGNRTPDKANDISEQKQSRGRRKGVNVGASDEDQSVCGSPSFGSAGRRRKLLSQASSTESDGHSSQGEGTPKRSSRIKHHADYHIMFTGVACTGADEATIKKLGGKVVQEPEDCTILITDKIRRTFKFLCIMGHGKPIVSPDWIKQSHLSGHFLDPWNFIVKDKEAEKKFHFQLQKSLKEASAKKLLDGFSVFATPSVKPPPSEMKGIVENCGGHFLTKEPSPGKWPEKSFIISAVDDKKLCSKFKKSSVPIVSAEILLTGILQQKLNVNDYILKL